MSRIVDMLRGMRVAVAHPPDQERDALVGQLRRIGCEAHVLWPTPIRRALGRWRKTGRPSSPWWNTKTR